MLPCISARIALLLTVLLAAAPSMAEQRRVFAAGSLRLALNEIVDKYAQVSGTRFEVLYGPSGKLREKIEQGDVPALFASAAVEHVQTLNDKGLLRSNVQFTRDP